MLLKTQRNGFTEKQTNRVTHCLCFCQLGGALGTNVLSVVLDRRTFFHSDVITSMQTAGNSTTMELLRTMLRVFELAGAGTDLQNSAALHYLGRVVQAQAYTMGFRDSFMIVALVFTLALIPAWIMGRTRARQSV